MSNNANTISGRVGLVGDITHHNMTIDPNTILSINTRPYRWLTIPIYVLYIIFFTLIWIKLQYISSIPWFAILIIILLADIINIFIKICHVIKETHYLLLNQIIQRSVSSLIELFGLLISKIGIYIFLTTKQSSYKLTNCMSPLWIAISIAFILRIYKLNISNYVNACLFMLLRGVQPFLIALQIDRFINIKWSIVFIPSWIFLFSGIGIAIIIITCAPYVHRSSSVSIREISYVLLYIFALQILITSVCILLFLIYIVQELDFLYNFNDGKEIGVIQVLWPLIVLFILLIVLHPILMRAIDRYQMSFLISMQLNATLTNILATSSHNVVTLEPINEMTWFLQINTNSYQQIDNVSLYMTPSELIKYGIGHIASSLSNNLTNQTITNADNDAEESIDNTVDEAIRLLNVCRVAYNNRSVSSNQPVHIPSSDLNAFDIELGSISRSSQHVDIPAVNNYTRVRTESDSLLDDLTRHSNDEINRPIDTISLNQESPDTCVVCLTNSCDCVLQPCGHLVLCYTCGQQIAKRRPSNCPICRKPIEKLYHKSIGPTAIGEENKIFIGCKDGFKISVNRQTLLSNSLGNLFDGLNYRMTANNNTNSNNNNSNNNVNSDINLSNTDSTNNNNTS